MKIYRVDQKVVSPLRYPRTEQQEGKALKFSKGTNFIEPLSPNPQSPYENIFVDSKYLKAQNIGFQHKSILKDLFKQGRMPSVKKGIYGNTLVKGQLSLEHLNPISAGGQTVLSNLALADKRANELRGNKPLADFLTKDMLESYLSQFNFVIYGKFDGFEYQDMIRRTCAKLGVGSPSDMNLFIPDKSITQIDYGNMKDIIAHIEDVDIRMLSKKMLRSLKNKGYKF